MRRLLAGVLSLSALLVAGPAAAQGQAAPTTVRYNEVERGFWVGSNVGAVVYFQTPGEGGSVSPGALVGFEVGYDLLPSLQLSALAWGQAVGADADYKGVTDPAADPKGARGDFQSLLLGGSLRWAPIRFSDENGIPRTYLYVRVAGGTALSRPEGVVGDGVWGSVAPGIEYFTRLRHFSVGMEVGGLAMKTDDGNALGLTILPHLKYSF